MGRRAALETVLGAVFFLGPAGCSAVTDDGATQGATGAGGSDPFAGIGASGSPTNGIPCSVATILQAHCTRCHAPPLIFGVPMALLTPDDFHRPAVTDPTRSVANLASVRVIDGAKPMPPPREPRLSPAELPTLRAWLDAGAPAAAPGESCSAAPGPTGMPTPSPTSAQTGSPTSTPTGSPTSVPTGAPTGAPTTTPTGVPTGTPTSIPTTPPPQENVTCFDLTSHGGTTPNDTTPYMIPLGESYHCFYFDVPWTAPSIATEFRSKLDNVTGLHHWFLYAMPTTHPNGASEACVPLHFDGPQMLAGWSPGAKDIAMPPDVGGELPATRTTLMVEWHYLNATPAPLADRSSVSVCTVPAGTRPKLASTTWIGTENLSLPPGRETSASGVCNPGRRGLGPTDPIQLLYAAPHMHQFGRHFTIAIQGGQNTTVLDQDFDVGNQAMVEAPFQLLPGDTLKTTCTFQNTSSTTVGWGGPFSNGEMCYGFVVHYPAHALDNGTRSLLGATNSCL